MKNRSLFFLSLVLLIVLGVTLGQYFGGTNGGLLGSATSLRATERQPPASSKFERPRPKVVSDHSNDALSPIPATLAKRVKPASNANDAFMLRGMGSMLRPGAAESRAESFRRLSLPHSKEFFERMKLPQIQIASLLLALEKGFAEEDNIFVAHAKQGDPSPAALNATMVKRDLTRKNTKERILKLLGTDERRQLYTARMAEGVHGSYVDRLEQGLNRTFNTSDRGSLVAASKASETAMLQLRKNMNDQALLDTIMRKMRITVGSTLDDEELRNWILSTAQPKAMQVP